VDHVSLYPALQRLERRGLITTECGTSEYNRRARYYRILDRATPFQHAVAGDLRHKLFRILNLTSHRGASVAGAQRLPPAYVSDRQSHSMGPNR
jgi:DNA-binding MarR family transcriptional regulator